MGTFQIYALFGTPLMLLAFGYAVYWVQLSAARRER